MTNRKRRKVMASLESTEQGEFIRRVAINGLPPPYMKESGVKYLRHYDKGV